MDEEGEEINRSSPRDDFNPLEENLPSLDCQKSDEDADRSSNDEKEEAASVAEQFYSLDGELEALISAQANEIAFSPPANARYLKREKTKSKNKQSYREFKSNMEKEKQKKPKSVVGVIVERYGESNNLFSGLSHVDSDADIEKDTRENWESKEKKRKERDEKQKSMTKNRQHDIYVKRSSEDFGTTVGSISSKTAPMDIQTPVVPVKLEGSGRFLSLGLSNTVAKNLPISPVASDKMERRQPCKAKVECPKDRLTFFKTFSALINMGSHGKKQKEQKEKERFLAQRQKSSDERLYMKYIWVGLQAALTGLAHKDQEDQILLEREKVPAVLQEVKQFRVQFSQSVLQESSVNDSTDRLSVNPSDSKANRDSSCSVDTEASADITMTYHMMWFTREMIVQQQEAMVQVQSILEKLDKCEQLYPTSAAFAQDFPLYKDPSFVRRLEALYLWLNVTKDLYHKLKVLGNVLNVRAMQGLNWPEVDFENEKVFEMNCSILRSSIPEISDTGEMEEDELEERGSDSDSDELSEMGEPKRRKKVERKVSFQFGERNKGRKSTSPSPYASPNRDRSPSAFGSPPDYSTPMKSSFYNTSISRASSEASIDDICMPSVYRVYVDKGLKKVGLNKMLIRLRDILYRSLRRARKSLEQPHGDLHSDSLNTTPSEEFPLSVPSLDLLDKSVSVPIASHSPEELTAWRNEFLDIGLPSYRPLYIFLLRVLLDVIHEAMNIRLEQLQNPIGEPSFLSIRQLIIECKDVLAKAVLVKQDYQCMVQAVLDDEEATADKSPLDLEKFDDDMSSMFKMYFQYLQNWLYHLQNLPEASRSLKNPLEEEWSFTKKICPHVIGGEAEAGKRFSTMAISLLNSISDFLEAGVDECTTNLFDWTTHDQSGSDEGEGDSDEDHDTSMRRSKSATSLRKSFQKTCRNFKNLFHEARERASKALGFAKLLRKDLEIAADFNIAVPMETFLRKLKETHHINVIAPLSAGYLMFIPERIAEHRRQIIQLLNVICGREDISMNSDLGNKEEGYLVMVHCGGGSDNTTACPVWDGPSIRVEPTAETTIALSHIQVKSLLLVVIHSSHLMNQRREFESLMGITLELVNEQTSCHQVIAESLAELKDAAITLREKLAEVITQVEKHWNCDIEMEESEKKHILKLYRETMLQAYNFGFELFNCDIKMEGSEKKHVLNLYRENMLQAYNFGFEYMKEVTRLVSGDIRHKLGRGLIDFVKEWMKFVSEKCERGRGMRPRWANQGLDFLLVACEPKILAVLTEQEYQELQHSINEFISHLIGNADKSSNLGGPLPMHRSNTDTFARQHYNRSPSWPVPHTDSKLKHSISSPHTAPAGSSSYSASPPPKIAMIDTFDTHMAEGEGSAKRPSDSSIEITIHDGDDGGLVMDMHPRHREDAVDSSVFSYSPHKRIERAIETLEKERNHRLREHRVIGRVTKHREVSYHINTRKVNFHWQKGNKIGEGQFGKVYCAVNMDTGELMAMKEMKFPTAETQHNFKDIIDEIKIFEGISHPNLVKYYGVEVHRTEMLVFMEYCDSGTLDQVSRVGLTEDLIRLYTKELLKAVQVLHDNKIMHRDIKGANVFLTSKGCLKLGDFGCSVKLKNYTTMAGEVNSLVGTTAYMAPEVFTKTDGEGHGRAADIWSLGCVVIEMASGKRPWHELESNFQIMFKVGMGEKPTVPENLGAEGKDFIAHCLEHEPDKRWMANELLDHPFAKIYDPENDEKYMNTSEV